MAIGLKSLLERSGIAAPPGDAPVKGLAYDSRAVQPGDLFFAVKGAHADGSAFIADAVKKGAVAAISETPASADVPVVVVPSILKAMARLADEFFDHPSAKLPVVGITGTNGKTTTTFLIEDIFRSMGKSCGVIGTVNYRIGREQWPAPNTTPMSIDVHRFLALMLERKAAAGVMEVSSHALSLNRVDHVKFACGVFTNLTQDHLDFHGTMEDYFQAKKKLFRRPEPVKAVVNVDDEYGRRLAKDCPGAITYGLESTAALRAEKTDLSLSGIRFSLRFPSGNSHPVSTNLLGFHNIYNCLSAAGAMLALGFAEDAIVKGLNQPHSVPGRLERVEKGQKFVVAVDYAHTHDALAQVLTTLRNTKPRRLICVFGAGGDRDKTKRPKMGKVAVELADDVFVTSDNPRSEVPAAIMKDIEAGIAQTGKKNYRMIENREEAIGAAIKSARDGDIVLIAGKGHETYQIYGTEKVHFSDFEAAERALAS